MNSPEHNFNATDAEEAMQGQLECQCSPGVTVNINSPIVITADSHDIIKVIAEMIAERTSKLHFDFNHHEEVTHE